jgi:hypothetical protein
MVAPTQLPPTFQLIACLGLISQTNNLLVNYAMLNQLCSFGERTVVTLAASTSNIPVNLATLFPGVSSAMAITLHDITNPAQSCAFSSNSTGTRFQLLGNGVMGLTTAGAPPTIYFDNTNTSPSYIEIGILGN